MHRTAEVSSASNVVFSFPLALWSSRVDEAGLVVALLPATWELWEKGANDEAPDRAGVRLELELSFILCSNDEMDAERLLSRGEEGMELCGPRGGSTTGGPGVVAG
ncbi:hypothetical protein EMCRGX_G011130 [Ephydatia muelleri]